MNELIIYVGKLYLTWQGRNRIAARYPFADTEIVSPGSKERVSSLWRAIYLNLHPTQYAVSIASDGQIALLKGGYIFPLMPGYFTLHYVDKQNRVLVMPRISDITRDGSQVSLELIITYRVIDPIKALEVQQPVQTLLSFITSDLKEFIRCRGYDDIVGYKDGPTIDIGLISRYIKEQHAGRHQMSKLFLIADVVVNDKIGDTKLTEIKGNFQIQHRQNIANTELLNQNQELEKKVASQDALIKQIKAESEAKQQEIQQKMKMQSMELERAKAALQYRQEIMMRAMDAIGQAFSASTYPMDPREVEIIKEIIGEFRGQTSGDGIPNAGLGNHPSSKQPGTSNGDRIGTLTDTLLNWLDYKRR